MDNTKLFILTCAFERIKKALDDWALLNADHEKEGIWYIAGIVEVTADMLKEVEKL